MKSSILNSLTTEYNPEHPLKTKLKALKISQVVLAKYAGVHHQTLFKMLNGYQPMQENIEQKLTELLQKVYAN